MYIALYYMYTLCVCVCECVCLYIYIYIYMECMSKLQRHGWLAKMREKNNYRYVRNWNTPGEGRCKHPFRLKERSVIAWFSLGIWKQRGVWGCIERGRCLLCMGDNKSHTMLKCPEMQRWKQELLNNKWPHTDE